MRYPVYPKATYVPCMGLFSIRNTRKLLNKKPFVTSTMHCLLSMHFCWFEKILAIWQFQDYPTENYHFLEFPTCEQKNGEDHKGCNITLCVSNCFCHIVCFLQPFPLIGRNMSEDWNKFTFQANQSFLITFIFNSVWSVLWVGGESAQNKLEATKWTTRAKRVDKNRVSKFVGIKMLASL